METRLQSNEVRIPKPEFDLSSGTPCQYFKSSFARSLSFSTNQTKSLDLGISFGLIDEENTGNNSLPPGSSNGQHDNAADNSGETTPLSIKDVWNNAQQSTLRKSVDSSEIEVLRLRKECQNLIEENRRLLSLAGGVGGNSASSNNYNNVEAVILQTQVDTLQWQLKQMESSRQMYRAVMEEVVRFLERCHRSLDAMQLEPISRSKSVHQVHQEDEPTNNGNENQRARSSTNLIDTQKTYTRHETIKSATIQPAGSYSNFRDFTWRRSPKHSAVSQHISNVEIEPEKLSQEAFRLLRTASNLLNTQEPMLVQAKSIIDNSLSSSSSSPHHHLHTTKNGVDSQSFCMTFNRKMNMRESRSSLRSSTDSNSSSSKPETDEEHSERPSPALCIPSHLHNHHHLHHLHHHVTNVDRIKEGGVASSAEDESGFSSMSSFQEIGLPLINSTQLSGASTSMSSSSAASDESTECAMDTSIELNISQNSTISINSSSQISSMAKIGLPSVPYHRRWDSVPVVPPKKSALHTFNPNRSGDESLRVLWV